MVQGDYSKLHCDLGLTEPIVLSNNFVYIIANEIIILSLSNDWFKDVIDVKYVKDVKDVRCECQKERPSKEDDLFL